MNLESQVLGEPSKGQGLNNPELGNAESRDAIEDSHGEQYPGDYPSVPVISGNGLHSPKKLLSRSPELEYPRLSQ